MRKGTFASTFGTGLQGGMKGAEVGSAFGPTGALVGGALGTAGGLLGGYFAGKADEPMDEAQLEQLRLSNQISEMQYRQMVEELRARKQQERNKNIIGQMVGDKIRANGGGKTFSSTFGE